MMKNKKKKVVGFLLFTVMLFSLCLGVKQGVQAEENQEPAEFAGATLIGNGTWTDTSSHKTSEVYFNCAPYFQAGTDKAPSKGPANIMLNQAYKTRMDNTVGDLGAVYGPGISAYYYFTLEKPAKVTIYGQCSTASNSYLAIQKMDSTDENYSPTTVPLGMVNGTDVVKSMSVCLSEGSYLVDLYWGQGRPTEPGTCYSYVKVNADYNINQETDSVWNEIFPNEYSSATPYIIGKVMNGITTIGNSTNSYNFGYYSFTIPEKTQFHLSDLDNVKEAYVYQKDEMSNHNKITDDGVILEPGDYILCVSAKYNVETYSFNSYTSAIPAIAGVDTTVGRGWSVSGDIVTINDFGRYAGDYADFCIWSGDKENAGYGKGTAKLVIKGNCVIKTLIIDCPVEVTCESGAQLLVGELLVNTEDAADGRLTYADGTTYNATTKTFEKTCAYTGLVYVVESDIWEYVIDDKPVEYTGLVYDENVGWWYVENGTINFAYNGLIEHNGVWWCVAGGRVTFEYTGLWYDELVGWWYVENGAINFVHNGLIEHNGVWWCVAGGRVALEYTGLWYDELVGWWYVENGAINFAHNGLIEHNGVWWCVAGGRVALEYTGLWYDELVGWWYVENGAINFAYNGLIEYNGIWWCVAGGRVAFEYTGLWYDELVGWWYVQNGIINFEYTGYVENEYGIRNVVNGRVVF